LIDRASAEDLGTHAPRAFAFFHQLARHNDRDWFHANQELYKRAGREPMEPLVRELGENASNTKITRSAHQAGREGRQASR